MITDHEFSGGVLCTKGVTARTRDGKEVIVLCAKPRASHKTIAVDSRLVSEERKSR